MEWPRLIIALLNLAAEFDHVQNERSKRSSFTRLIETVNRQDRVVAEGVGSRLILLG